MSLSCFSSFSLEGRDIHTVCFQGFGIVKLLLIIAPVGVASWVLACGEPSTGSSSASENFCKAFWSKSWGKCLLQFLGFIYVNSRNCTKLVWGGF